MYYNKRFGLKFLNRALSGIDGATVLPWREYVCRKRGKNYSFDSYLKTHFPNAQRLLLRTDLHGSIPFEEWNYLPRPNLGARAPPPAKVRSVMRKTAINYMETFHKRTLWFLLHPVSRRKNYALYGSLYKFKRTNAKPFVRIGTSINSPNWRNRVLDQDFELFAHKNKIIRTLVNCGLSRKEAVAFHQTMVESYKKIRENEAKHGFLKTNDVWEASFAVPKKDKTIEFYDFLYRKGRRGY